MVFTLAPVAFARDRDGTLLAWDRPTSSGSARSGVRLLGQATGSDADDAQLQEAREIIARYYAGDHQAVVRGTDAFLAKYRLTERNFSVLLYKAESQYRLSQIDAAIASYQRAVPFIEKLNNVLQRRFASVFFRLGFFESRRRQYDSAIRWLEAGLTREPQNVYSQILLGELFTERGDGDRALKHFQDLLASAIPTTEERVVLTIKIDRLRPPAEGGASRRIDMAAAPFYAGFSVGLLPLNWREPSVLLRDICVILESKWLVPCEVLPPRELDEARILDSRRGQYDGERLLDELNRLYPSAQRPHRYLVALTSRDIFGRDTNFVFSWQDRSLGVGVVSAYRFLAELDEFYERPIIGTRRLGIQFISTTSSLLGIQRATRPDCPTAYPHDLREFQQKGSRLCESTIRQRDELLKARGGGPGRVGAQRNEEINRVYRTYYLD